MNLSEWIVGGIFGAGGLWFLVRQMRKDVNGIGARQRRFEKNVLLWAMKQTEKEEDRRWLADLFRE
jgi:hypothetical protein